LITQFLEKYFYKH